MAFRDRAFDAMANVIERDRAVVFDPTDGLYTGEQSFLDWREQTYPGWGAGTGPRAHRDVEVALDERAPPRAARRGGHPRDGARRHGAGDALARVVDALRAAIRARFWDDDARQFRAFTTTALDPSAVRRCWDLLGTSLAVLHGIATDDEARDAIARYPHAGAGPAVIWPQQQRTPIYHNRASWPFVTAYLLRAARRVRNNAVVTRDLRELMRGAAMNLSNMENFEFLSGSASVSEGET